MTEGVTVVDSSGTEVDNDVFEDVARDPSTGVLVIQYDTGESHLTVSSPFHTNVVDEGSVTNFHLLHSWIESVSLVTSPVQCQSSVPDSSDSYNAVVISEGPSRKRQRLDEEAKQVRADGMISEFTNTESTSDYLNLLMSNLCLIV